MIENSLLLNSVAEEAKFHSFLILPEKQWIAACPRTFFTFNSKFILPAQLPRIDSCPAVVGTASRRADIARLEDVTFFTILSQGHIHFFFLAIIYLFSYTSTGSGTRFFDEVAGEKGSLSKL